MVIPFSFIKSGASYDPDAQAIFTSVGDVPDTAKAAISQLISDHKTNNLWTKLKYGIIAIPTMTANESMRDIKTNTLLATAPGTGSAGLRAYGYPIGFLSRTGGADYINTGVTMASLMTLNSSAIVSGMVINETTAQHDFGSLQSATQRTIFTTRNGSNQAALQMYHGSQTVTSAGITDARGIWINNRNANNFLETVRNGTQVGTNTTIQASAVLPTINNFIFCYNNAGTPSTGHRGIQDIHAYYDGLSTAERTTLNTIWTNFRTNIGRANPTRQIVLDGNSLNMYQNQRMFRRCMYDLSVLNKSYNNTIVWNFSVAGQTTAQMNSDYATQVAPVYDASLSKNFYIIQELGNSIYLGATVATAKSDMQTLIAAAKATGYTVVLMVPTARTYVGNTGRTETQWNLAMDELVQWARVPANSGANYVCDVTDSRLWVDRSSYASDAAYNTAISSLTGNTTYYTDSTHLTDAGFDIRGVDLKNTLQPIL
jgi:hypothetical protein